MTKTAPFGSWESPVDAAKAVSQSVGFGDIRVDGDDLYWMEFRPAEDGRQVLVRRQGSDEPHDVIAPEVNVRTRVHEYGGGDYLVADGTVVYSDDADQRLYRLSPGGAPEPITPEPPRPQSLRYADGRVTGDHVLCVRESHPPDGEAVNELVLIPLDGSSEPEVVFTGTDFVASPRLSPDGSRVAWLSWDHPNMPWDGTHLWVAAIDAMGNPERVAGGEAISVVQPEWGPDGSLYFAADPGEWWNLFRYDGSTTRTVLGREVEAAFPQWLFGQSSYGFLSGGRIAVAYFEDGVHRLGILDAEGSLEPLDLGYSLYDSVATDADSRVFFVGLHPRRPTRIVDPDIDRDTELEVRANPDLVDPAFVPDPRRITFPTGDGERAHAFYYPPTNPDFVGPDEELPPLRVMIHGGPTSNVVPALRVAHLYWTSRGFGVVDVNYRGSTGYGRPYRDRLKGQWGIIDVEDAAAAGRYLADKGLVDPERLTITGGSAGGFTTLASLAFDDAFAAGSSYYGVADLELLEASTHKFESRYENSLVGSKEAMRDRSPINHLDGFDRPVILFQGLEDTVVPPDQARLIADALDEKGVTHALVLYEGEDHGFRSADNIVHSLEAELSFFGHVLGFEPAGDLATAEVKHPR